MKNAVQNTATDQMKSVFVSVKLCTKTKNATIFRLSVDIDNPSIYAWIYPWILSWHIC